MSGVPWARTATVAALVCLILPTPAQACGQCCFAMADMVLPPIGLWCLLAASWFVASAVVASRHRVTLPLQPRLLPALGLSLIAALFGSPFVGPFVLLPLALPPALGLASALKPTDVTPRLAEPARRAIRRVGAVHGALALVLLGALVQTLATRAGVDVMLRWPYTPPMMARLHQLEQQGASALPQWRELVDRSTSGLLVAESVEQLAALGDPVVDVPRIERALDRLQRARTRDETSIERVTRALETLRAR
jgi:hypothetical protein